MRTLFPVLLSLSAVIPATAGIQNVDCRNPQVFPEAVVNVVILPYRYAGPADSLQRSIAAQRLGLVLQREILLSLLPYPSVGTVQMMQPPSLVGACEADTVIAQVFGKKPGARSTVQAGNGAVFLWGILYEEAGDLYVRSFARFKSNVRGGDAIKLRLGAFPFEAPMPVESVAFAPVRITDKELAYIEQWARRGSVVRPRPDPEAPGEEIPFDPRFPFAYTVNEARQDWMFVTPMSDGPKGWMQVRPLEGSLSQKMPEIRFVVSAAGYLTALKYEAAGRAASAAGILRTSRRALADFERATPAEVAPEASAAARVLEARLRLLEDRSAEAWKSALASVDQALQWDNSNPDLRNLQSICRAWLVYNGAAEYPPTAIAQGLKDAAVRSSDPRVLANLASLYRTMLVSPQLRAGGDEVIRAELKKLDRMIPTAR